MSDDELEPRAVSAEEVDALAVLARYGRIVAVLIPRGIPREEIEDLAREIDTRLEELARRARRS